jgi:hypothetical protein
MKQAVSYIKYSHINIITNSSFVEFIALWYTRIILQIDEYNMDDSQNTTKFILLLLVRT